MEPLKGKTAGNSGPGTVCTKQQRITMILEPIYEQDFLDCSYGFRPGRSAHQALSALRNQIMDMRGGWVLEIDIRQFFDHLDHSHLKAFVRQRVRDGVIVRLINKWLHAGVLEDGRVSRPATGSPQGGVISPMLANLFLHEVLDKWFEHDVRSRMRGASGTVRYADDAVMVFQCEDDARRVLEVLPKRFEKYGLQLHPEKTGLVRFERPPRPSKEKKPRGPRPSKEKKPRGPRPSKEKKPRGPRPDTFDFLGFTHHWGVSRKGNTVVKRRTAGSRLRRAIGALNTWCRLHRHDKVQEQHEALSLKLRGHYAYYGITGNISALRALRRLAERAWRKWLDRRSGKRHMPWTRFKRLLARYALPAERIVHPV